MAEPLIAVAVRRANALHLHVAAPVSGGGHGARMRAEADQSGLGAEVLPAKLAYVKLVAHDAHLSVPGIADMRVMGPHDGFRVRTAGVKDMAERFKHVRIAQFPRLRPAVIHDAVIALG